MMRWGTNLSKACIGASITRVQPKRPNAGRSVGALTPPMICRLRERRGEAPCNRRSVEGLLSPAAGCSVCF